MKKEELARKMIKEPLSSLIKEHKRLVPELKGAGLKKEANKQKRELNEYEKEAD